jgi:integrase
MSLKLYRRPGSKVWYVRGTVRGIHCYETSGTSERTQAEAYRATREAELYEQSVFGARAVATFAQAAVSYLEFAERDQRTRTYTARLVNHFGNSKRLGQIDQTAADRAVTAIVGNEAAPATKRRGVYTPLAAILNHAADRKWCERPKFRLPTVPTGKTRWLTPVEALALVAAAAPHLKPHLHFVVCTGARLSEALDLDWADVDLPAAKVVFRYTKNGFDRVAALPEAALFTLANLPGEELEPGVFEKRGRVFRRDDGKAYVDRERLEGGQIKTGWRGALKRAGIAERTTPHDMRHYPERQTMPSCGCDFRVTQLSSGVRRRRSLGRLGIVRSAVRERSGSA